MVVGWVWFFRALTLSREAHQPPAYFNDSGDTSAFAAALAELEAIARRRRTVFMCAEAVWWRCHRSMVSDALKAKGWTVLHLMSASKAEEHPYTSPACVSDGHVSYAETLCGNKGGKMTTKTAFKVGDVVNWNSEAGRVSGTIIKVHVADFDYKGHTHRATKEDPQYEIKSSKTDHIAAHKGRALTKGDGVGGVSVGQHPRRG